LVAGSRLAPRGICVMSPTSVARWVSERKTTKCCFSRTVEQAQGVCRAEWRRRRQTTMRREWATNPTNFDADLDEFMPFFLVGWFTVGVRCL
jgi:hypothetical protein